MKIALIGSNGQLGTFLKDSLKDHDVKCFTRKNIDITTEIPKDFFLEFDSVINCAGFVNSKAAEYDKNNIVVNFDAVKNIYNSLSGQKFIHISSLSAFQPSEAWNKDMDFLNGKPYREYDKAKWAADVWLNNNASNFLVIRPGWLISSGENNFINKMRALNFEGYKVVDDDIAQITSGKMILDVIELSLISDLEGFINVSSADLASRYEMLVEGFKQISFNKEINRVKSYEIGWDIENIKYQWMNVERYNNLFGAKKWVEIIKEWKKEEWIDTTL